MTALLPANMRAKIVLELCPVAGLEGFCWAWTGALTSRGYGSVGIGGKVHSTHTAAYELLVGPIPAGLQIDHLCVNKRCCNPAHLEPVTGKVNCERTAQATKTICVNGHRYTPENTVIRKRASGLTIRNCRTCRADCQREARRRKRELSAVAA